MSKTYDHFARPLPVDGKTPTRGDQICRVCGEPIHRYGVLMMSDGVRGHWRHGLKEALDTSTRLD